MIKFEPEPIVRAVQHVMGETNDGRGLPPPVGPRERAEVWHWLKADPIGQGAVRLLEARLEALLGVRFAIATSSGTAALHLALAALGVRPDHRVVVPSLAFVAAANAVTYCGAIPYFVDAGSRHLGVNVENLRFPKPTGARAVIGIDLLGHPGDMGALEMWSGIHEVPLIEDASQALGSREMGRACGSFGRLGVLSFNVNKIVTTGGGGAVLTDDPALAEKVRFLGTQAKDAGNPWGYDHLEVGYNYRMPNLSAALALRQLEHLDERVLDRRVMASRYRAQMEGLESVEFVDEPQHCYSNFWMPALRIANGVEGRVEDHRNVLLFALAQAGLQGRAIFTPLHTLPPYRKLPRGPGGVAEDLYRRLVCLPVRPTPLKESK